ncbi:uncharacterized protein FFUJ_12762 [Fusarium fujikuroi IMI 58289]|uniref:Zn(2)-C6 fungal-type domain-containing protein n=1 Tax=Gibberella fujikuroi (strain CBS 195.34 / IMI 58289 / NRRL A-6831) TaxID=1279085 RepID=S0EKD7_GIBF5|nr:uncharacterized protein FFUJ_12762 [Fusarium fujikuroi IMI 58289]KLP21506.1 uncharacterized protein LW94_1017 [Fusarium fujikuroi]CCT72868.1 uncharacterized protein FFUJ_12762 [Fusarium fujikuroi IMI 58289]SCO25050.1 uncharacterized protein FFM5_13939 [Fusarium fujikuroi]SCO54092.1 uncharacterized protein FFMR_11640 [Fusarium fujikuroi]
MERNDPPARRKSCQACKKARRRCDLARPTCQRCAQRNIHCHYPSAPAPREGASCIHPEIQISNIEGLLAPSCFGMLDSILEPTDHFADQLFDGSLDCDTSNWSTPRLSTTAQNALNRSQLVTIPQVTRSISSRLQYAMDAILKGPSQMVSENQTPWCHSHLYDDGMPKSMQHAVSSAALHAAKNHLNARVIRENVESRVQELLASPPPATPVETLAYAQALFIYQIIRLLDNDARTYAIYEATMPHLEEASNALIPHIAIDEEADSPSQSSDLIPLFPASAAQAFWTNWIFQESAKRTLGMINFFMLTYYFMKGESGNRCGQNKNIAVNRSVTMSAHLWNAQDPVDFALAWRNKKHFVINVSAPNFLETILHDAQKDDVDAFGKICLTSLMGLTEAKGWLAMKGIAL